MHANAFRVGRLATVGSARVVAWQKIQFRAVKLSKALGGVRRATVVAEQEGTNNKCSRARWLELLVGRVLVGG